MDKIKTLFFAASPVGSSGLMVEEEIRAITKKIRTADDPDSIELVPALAARADDLIEMLNQHKPQIVHFSAHGKPTGEILLLDKVGGLPKAVKSHAIRELFKTMKDNIRVVLLNACYSKVQARAIVKVIDCAIGINIPITNQAAIAFAASFYGALGFGRSVKEAYEQGRAAILLEGIDKKNIPELLVKEGVDPSRIFLRPPLLVSQKKGTGKNVTFEEQVLKYCLRIPALEHRENRDILINNLPNEPVRTLNRSNSTAADLNEIVKNAKGWGQIRNRKKCGLEIILENTLRFVSGTEMEGELDSLLTQASSREEKQNVAVEKRREDVDILIRNENSSKTSSPKMVLTMMGAQGGVGKSTITCRMAEMIAETGHNVVIIDLDTGTAGSTTLQKDRGNSIVGSISVYEILSNFSKNRETPKTAMSPLDVTPQYLSEREISGKVFLIPAAPLMEERSERTIDLIRRIDPNLDSLTMRKVMDQIMAVIDNLSKTIDCIIIDCGAEGVEFNPLVAEAHSRSTITYIIVQPNPICGENITHVAKLLKDDLQKVRVIINRIVSSQHEDVAKSQFSKYEISGCIKEDRLLFEDIQKGRANHRYGYDVISRDVHDILTHDLPTDMVPSEADLWIRPTTRTLLGFESIGYIRKTILKPFIIRNAVYLFIGLVLLSYSTWQYVMQHSISKALSNLMSSGQPNVDKIKTLLQYPFLLFIISTLLGVGFIVFTIHHILSWRRRIHLVSKLHKVIKSSSNPQNDIEEYLLALNTIESNFDLLRWLRDEIKNKRRIA